MNTFGNNLKNLIKLNKFGQKDFAEKMNTTEQRVSEWLKGKAKPGYDLLKCMAMTFNVSADYFLGINESY